jgi:hypothetical protein
MHAPAGRRMRRPGRRRAIRYVGNLAVVTRQMAPDAEPGEPDDDGDEVPRAACDGTGTGSDGMPCGACMGTGVMDADGGRGRPVRVEVHRGRGRATRAPGEGVP